MFGLTIQKSRWYGDFAFEYAGLSASRTTPHIKFNVDARIGGVQIGYDVWKHIYVTGGASYLGLSYGITFQNFPSFNRSPGDWDPLIGVMWQKQVSKKWTLLAKAQGGGFGVGTDEQWMAVGKADWQFAKHFGLLMGYGLLHFKVSDTKLGKTLTVNQTLNGPQFGFGIYF